MTITETTNETRRPIDKITHSFSENPIPCFLKYEMISAALAPSIMGIDMKKENSAVKSNFKCSEQADKHFADYVSG